MNHDGSITCIWFCILLFASLVELVSSGNTQCPPSFACGHLGKIHFPFTDVRHPDCGLLVIHGCDDHDPEAVKTIKNKGTWFYVVKLDQFTIIIRDDDLHALLLSRRCGVFSNNYTFDTTSPFFSFQFNTVTLQRCNHTLNVTPPKSFSKSMICPDDIFYDTANMDDDKSLSSNEYNNYFGACSMVQLPIRDAGLKPDPSGNLFDFVSAEIPIQVKVSPACSSCYYLRGGKCQLDNQGKFFCAQGTRTALF